MPSSSILKNLQGDRAMWAVIALMGLLSFMPVYSASSNLQYVVGRGTSLGYLLKHAMLLVLGFAIVFGVHKIPYHYFKGLSLIAMPIMFVLLIYTLAQGTTIEESNASRWIRIPFFGISFQTSILASVTLLAYVARYLSKFREAPTNFKKSLVNLWLPVFLFMLLILPANFSTSFILFVMVLTVCFLGGYPSKYTLRVIGMGVLGLTFFVLVAKVFPNSFSNRVDTWGHRIENFFDDKNDPDGDYQIEKAKTAIATGGLLGVGAGKSVMKNFLPQSSSDFIFAIIIEEYGLFGGLFLMFLYMLLLLRIAIVIKSADTTFGKLLVAGAGFPVIFQALVNMAVAVSLMPVTGQNLPLISSGGTSIWINCLSIGIILSVSKGSSKKAEAQKLDSEPRIHNPLDVLSATV